MAKKFSDNEDEVAEVFRIDTNIFDFETPICKTFKEFNYLLQIGPDLLTKDIEGFKTYDEYKDDWIYLMEQSKYHLREDGYCNGGNLPRDYHIRNSLHYQDREWYEALKDSKLKDEALRNNVIMEGLISNDESSNDYRKRWKIHEINYHNYDEGEYENETQCKEGQEYVAVKEEEYDDLTNTSKEARRAYQEIFRMMDEGWMETRTE
ncbi:hypothetical protein Tco_0541272 [Tanacetum coccineum]